MISKSGPTIPTIVSIPSIPGSSGAAAPGPSSGDGFYLEDGTDYLLLETGDFLLQE